MKKRTKFKLRNDLVLPFRIAVITCLFGAAISYTLFHTSFFRALSKLDESPIATITFKYKTAERKFLDRVVWDRLRQNSPVYNGDTIHTAELSEATVWFEDGTSLELFENTMAQVFLHDNGSLGAELTSGSASVDSSDLGRGLTLSSSNVQVEVKAGSKLSAKKVAEDRVNLSLQRGQALLADGENITQGDSFSLSSDGSKKEILSVLAPSQNEKFLYYNDSLCHVDFKWKNHNQQDDLVLVLASDKELNHKVQTINVSGLDKITVSIPEGIYYWKLSDKGEKENQAEESPAGKIQIIQSLKPELIIPADDFSYAYRKQPPSIRFIWEESEGASAYNFAISKREDMTDPLINQRTSSPSIIISTLEEGSYYYQVTPYYLIGRLGLANPSQVRKFKIIQREELSAPLLVSPGDKAFVNKRKGSESLSWQMNDEPMKYRLAVSKSASLSSPLISRETSENYVNLKSSELEKLADGEYYWGVKQIDSEGNESPMSKVRVFYAINGEIEQRTIFPPDSYSIWSPLLSDIRFTWKSNLNLTQYFQLAKDEDFKNLVYEREASSSGINGLALGQGDYYWRITTKDENFKRSSDVKKISIVSELKAPQIQTPNIYKKAAVRPTEPCKFTWKDEDQADYYRIKIFRAGEESPLYDENFITEEECQVNVEDYAEGFYRWQLQSYVYESELSSRRSSVMAESEFELRKIHPAKLLSPKNGTRYKGWTAIEKPPLLKWNSKEEFSTARIVLTKKSGHNAGESIYLQRGFQQQLPPLASGLYEWKVEALTLDELDISSLESYTFTVEEIPPFEAPLNAATAETSLFNADYLRKSPFIVFNWDKVQRADSYILEILNAKKRVIYREVLDGNENTSLKYEKLTALSKGDFSWRVKAALMSKDKKKILVDGNYAENSFTIEYNLNTSGGKRKNTGTLYAK